ncbi:MAG TPA: thioredoxin domain-containing protein [Caulobacteraceae bacterium]
MSRRVALGAAALAVMLTACQGQSDKAFGERVHAYLLAHPEVLAEASQKLQANQEADVVAAQRKAEAGLPALRNAIERDPRDFVANPNGKVTVTEFYDYRCPHCEAMAPRLLAVIHDRPDVRFVFKEMPIFGATSEHAAYAAIAVKQAGGDFLGLYRDFMTTQPLTDAAIDRIALARGAKPAAIAPSSAGTSQLAATSALFNKLALDGTPGFVVGDRIMAGDDMVALGAAIDKARASKVAG